MVLVMVRNPQLSEEGPAYVNINNVQYWSRHTKELKHSQSSKALKFLEYDCLKYIGVDEEFGSKYCFVCLPLNTQDSWNVNGVELKKKPYECDYNNSDYKIFKNSTGNFICNCQGYNIKLKRNEVPEGGAGCSHVLALFYSFKIKRFGRDQGAEEHHIKPYLRET
jgi:hypothetical protein